MNKEKSLTKNFIYNTLFTVLNLIFPIITLPYISRIILAEGIGKVNIANSIVNYFLIIATLGIPIYGVREISRVRNNKDKLAKTLSEIFTINFISTIVCIIMYYIMINSVGYFEGEINLYVIIGVTLVMNVFNFDWFYQGLEEYRFIAIRSAIIKMISLGMLFIFVKTKEDYVIYALINILALSGNNIINFINVRRISFFKFKDMNIVKHLKPIFVLLSIQVAVNVYINLDVTMTGFLAGDASAGYYGNAIKINKIVTGVVTSMSTILLPRLSYCIENKDYETFTDLVSKAFKGILFISIPAMIGLFFLSEEIITLLCGEGFIAAIPTMKILVPLVVLLGVGNLFGTQILIPLGHERKLLISVIIGAVVSFVLNLILIPLFKQNGTAVAIVTAEFVVMVVQVVFALKYTKIKIGVTEIKTLIISNVSMIVILFAIQKMISNLLINIIVSVIAAVLCYVIVNIKFKNPLMQEILAKVLKK